MLTDLEEETRGAYRWKLMRDPDTGRTAVYCDAGSDGWRRASPEKLCGAHLLIWLRAFLQGVEVGKFTAGRQ